MDVFHRMAYTAAANLMGVSASHRISNEQLAEQFQRIALEDPDLDEHYARLASAVPVLQVKRAMEDLELEAVERPRAA
jgi:hypothetical protein